jgi:hypothetical protein
MRWRSSKISVNVAAEVAMWEKVVRYGLQFVCLSGIGRCSGLLVYVDVWDLC